MCAMHGFSIGRSYGIPGAGGGGQVSCAGRPPPAPRTRATDTHSLHTATFAVKPTSPGDSLLISFPGAADSEPPTRRSPHRESLPQTNARYHFNHRGGPVKRLLDAKSEVLDTPFRYRRFSPAASDHPQSPAAEHELGVCNLNKLNNMLDAESRQPGDGLPVLSSRSKGKSKNTFQRQTHSYGIMDNAIFKMEQMQREANRDKEKERERERKKSSEKDNAGDHVKDSSIPGICELPSSDSGSFLRGSAIETVDDKPVKLRRPSYDARAYANKGPRRRSKDRGKVEKFSSLPNISKLHNLTSTECTAYMDSDNACVRNSTATFKPPKPSQDKLKVTKDEQPTKLPNIVDVQSEVSYSATGKYRMTQSEPGGSSVAYSYHGSTSKVTSRQRLSLKQMTEAFRQRMGERYGKPKKEGEDKRWADKMSKVTSVIDNNSYDAYARKPLPRYSVSKLVLTQASPSVAADGVTALPVQEETGEEADDLDLPVGYINKYDSDYAGECYDEDPYEIEPVPVPPEWTRSSYAPMGDGEPFNDDPHSIPADYVEAMEYYGHPQVLAVNQDTAQRDNIARLSRCGADLHSNAATIHRHPDPASEAPTIVVNDAKLPLRESVMLDVNISAQESHSSTSYSRCQPAIEINTQNNKNIGLAHEKGRTDCSSDGSIDTPYRRRSDVIVPADVGE